MGDQCNKYFFSILKQRRQQAICWEIYDQQDQCIEGREEVALYLAKFYENMLGMSSGQRVEVKPMFSYGNTLSLEQQMELCKPVTALEIKNAMFSISSNKSPGPDGYSSSFFKSNWHIVGSDVTQAIQEFFNTGDLLSQVNATNLVLILKIACPSRGVILGL